MSRCKQDNDTLEADPQAVTPELVVIPTGEFLMGETDNDKFATDTERPVHRVRIEHPFALGKFVVTEMEYRRFISDSSLTVESNLPVVNVSWEDAREYCAWLSAKTGKPLRLPTEAEWEYACRAGTRTPFGTGNEIQLSQANFLYAETGERVGPGERVSIHQDSPNDFGVCGLHGNVCEWVEDAWHPNYEGAPTDGSAWASGGDATRRAIRGGAWDYLPRLLRSAWRDSLPQQCRRDNVGFRVALSLENS